MIREICSSGRLASRHLVAGASMLLMALATGQAFAADSIKVGAVLPLTGGFASTAQDEKLAIELAVEEINKAGGIASMGGAKIDLLFADDQSNPRLSGTETERLITQQQVKLLIGPTSSSEMSVASVVAERNQVPMLNPLAWGDSLYTRDLKYLFGLPGRGVEMGVFQFEALQYLMKEHGLKPGRIAVVSNSTPTAEGMAQPLVDMLKKAGFDDTILVAYDPQAADLTPVVLRLKGEKIGTVMGFANEPDGVRFNRARMEQDYAPNIIAGVSGYAQPSIRKVLGPDGTAKYLGPGVFVLNLASYDMQTPGWKHALEAGKQKYGSNFQPSALPFASGYQAMLLMKAVLEKAGSLDAGKIKEAISTLTLKKGSPEQVVPFKSDLTWAPEGYSKGLTFALIQFQGPEAKEVTVFPPDIATAKPVVRTE